MELTEIELVQKKQFIASSPEYSIWTNASAGSGKTTVLVKRLLRLLINDVDPSKILCITFTNTGAAEMRNRINAELANWSIYDNETLEKEIVKLEGSEKNLKEKVKKARVLFAKILDAGSDFKILTIHAFCQQIIKRFPLEAGLTPNFKIADEIYSAELINEARDILINLKDEEIQESIANVIIYKNENDFFSLLKDIISKKDKFLYLKGIFITVDEIVREMCKITNIDYDLDIEKLENEFVKYNGFSTEYQIIFDNLEKYGKATDKKYVPILEKWQKSTQNERKNLINEYLNVFITSDNKPRQRIVCKELQQTCMGFEILLENEKHRVLKFFNDRNNTLNILFTKDILKITYKIFDIYKILKDQNSCLDYNDLIIETTRLLSDDKYRSFGDFNIYSNWINYKLDSGIDHLLIDEAQDTSPIQWDIVSSLTQEFFAGEGQNENTDRTIFVVGDEKQSIFSFQGADPNIFHLKLKEYTRNIENSGKELKEIYMETSFRSLQSILKITDEVFKDIEKKEAISKIDKPIKHSIVRKEGLGKVELWSLIGLDIEKKEEKPWSINYEEEIELTNRQKLAQTIAEQIKYWFDNGKLIYDKKTKEKRLIRYSDIMVLVRKRNKNFINYLIRELSRRNIPIMGSDRFDLLNNIVAEDILALCNFVLFNEDDLNLANLIKSPFLNLNENDLYIINKYRLENNCSLWSALKNTKDYSKQDEFLNDLIEKSKKLSPFAFLFYIFETKQMRSSIKSRFIYTADEIINEFLNLAKDYENDNINANLLGFITFLKNTEIILKRDMEQDVDEVKLITVHSSKGLEAPIVILPDADQISGKNDTLKFHRDFNNGYEMPFLKVEDSDFFSQLNENIKNELNREYLRLLYVALTRAGNELYICDYKSKKENSERNSWYNFVKNAIEPMAEKKKSNFFEGDILYIGDNDEFSNNTIKPKEDTENNLINEIINNIKRQTISKKRTKIINPSIFFGDTQTINIPKKQNININRGQAVHRILEILPDIETGKREQLVDYFLQYRFKDLEDREEIKKTIFNIINNKDFQFLFGENSIAEVPIFGRIDDNIILGKIDRLSIDENTVHIVDYKTNGKIPKITPEKYIKQLELYKKLLEKIYTKKSIRCYILWTSFGKIEEIQIT